MFDGRWRFDACLFAAQMDGPWPDLPEKFGPWGTVRRQFQRWAHNGTWSRLLEAVAAPDSPLAGLEYALCRAHRRAWRLLDLKGIRHARELGLESALRAPPEYLPDPNLSLFVNSRFILPRIETYLAGEAPRPSRQELRAWNGLLRLAGGRAVIRRHMAPP
jgi:transposase